VQHPTDVYKPSSLLRSRSRWYIAHNPLHKRIRGRLYRNPTTDLIRMGSNSQSLPHTHYSVESDEVDSYREKVEIKSIPEQNRSHDRTADGEDHSFEPGASRPSIDYSDWNGKDDPDNPHNCIEHQPRFLFIKIALTLRQGPWASDSIMLQHPPCSVSRCRSSIHTAIQALINYQHIWHIRIYTSGLRRHARFRRLPHSRTPWPYLLHFGHRVRTYGYSASERVLRSQNSIPRIVPNLHAVHSGRGILEIVLRLGNLSVLRWLRRQPGTGCGCRFERRPVPSSAARGSYQYVSGRTFRRPCTRVRVFTSFI
jgi:hypothetical protein